MKLAQNLKETAVGQIPIDWDAATVSDVARITTGSRNTQDKVEDGKFPFFVRSQTVERINSFSFDGEAVLTAGDGVGTGKVFHYINGPFDCHQRVYRISDFTDRMNGFYFFKYFSASFYDRIMSMTAKSSVDSVRREMIADMALPVPPIDEQKRIANAFKDIDDLIASLDALIAKKRDIKQAAMQQLLTGNTRLPGFEGEWSSCLIGGVADCLDNLRVPLNEIQRRTRPGIYPYCGANGIVDYIGDYLFDDDVILLAEDGGYFDEFSTRPIAYKMSGKMWVNNHAHIIKAKAGICQGFIFYSLVHKNILPFLASGTRAKLNKSELMKIEIMLPKSEAEQAAISSAFESLDSELDALRRKLEKYHQLKQGMMQQLLTGRIRLV